MEPNLACEDFWIQEMFLLWFETPPSSGRGALIQMKHKFLHNSGTNQANGTKLGMWKILRTKNVSVMVWDPSSLWKEGHSYKWNTNFYITRELIKQMEPNLACESFWRQEKFLWWFATPPLSERRGPHINETNFYIIRELIKQMDPNLACESFWRQEMFLWWFATPPPSERRGPHTNETQVST